MERKKEPKSSITAVFYIYEVYYMAFKSEMWVIDEAHHPKIPQIHKHTTQHRLELPHILPANTLPQKHTVMIVLGHTHIASHAVPCAASHLHSAFVAVAACLVGLGAVLGGEAGARQADGK